MYGRIFRRAYTTPVNAEKLTYYEAKARLTKTNKSLRLLIGATALATIGGITYNLYDFNTTNNLSKVISMLKEPSEESILEGLSSLNDCFYINKRVFSGKTSIPISSSCIESYENELVGSLMKASQHNFSGIRWKALSWLYDLATSHHNIRTQLVKQNKIEDLAAIASNPVHGEHSDWLIAANVLLQICKDQHAFNNLVSRDRILVSDTIEKLSSNTDNPLALFVASQLSDVTGSPTMVQGYGGELGGKLLATALKDVLAPTTQTVEEHTGAGFLSILGISAFASVWGGLRWKARALSKGLYDAEGIRQFLKARHVGRNIFILLFADMVAQRFMKFASTETLSLDLKRWDEQEHEKSLLDTKVVYEGIKEINAAVSQPHGPPLSSVYPIVQTALFGTSAMVLLRTQRYVMLPLLIAAAYNHRDVLARNETVQYVMNVMLAGIPGIPGMTTFRKELEKSKKV